MNAGRSSHGPDRGGAARRLLHCLLACLLVLGSLAPLAIAAEEPITGAGLAANLVRNWSFEDTTWTGDTATDRVGKEWTAFELSGTPDFRRCTEFVRNPERIDGKDCQLITGKQPFDAGIYQIVSGLTINQWYSVVAFVLTVFETAAHADPSALDGLIVRQIGVDPKGGRNPLAESVIWGPPIDKNMDRNTWGQRLTFRSEQSTATLFIRAQALQATNPAHPTWYSQVYIDAVQLRLSAVAQAIVPEEVQSGPFTVSWEARVPGAFAPEATVIEYDVQYRDGSGPWQDWQLHATGRSAIFSLAQPGHTYSFRVRAWARYTNPFTEIFGPWAESAPVQIGRVVKLTVLDNRGHPVRGVSAGLLDDAGRVAATGATDAAGELYLAPGAGGLFQVTASPQWFLPPAPIHGVTVDQGIEPVTLTLRPPDDALADGSFEAAALGQPPEGWTVLGAAAKVTTFDSHGGLASLHLSTDANSQDVCIRRSFVLDGAYDPALSLWYRLDPGRQALTVQKVLVVSLYRPDAEGQPQEIASAEHLVQEPTLWQHLSLPASVEGGDFSGEVTLQICLQDPPSGPATFAEVFAYVDDISLGSAAGGPFRAYAPVAVQPANP